MLQQNRSPANPALHQACAIIDLNAIRNNIAALRPQAGAAELMAAEKADTDWTEAAGTIAYKILTRIGGRTVRTYTGSTPMDTTPRELAHTITPKEER